MMDVITLNAESRGTGTKAARAVRREGKVPCVLYGHHNDPVAFSVGELDINKLIYTDEAYRVKIDMDGESWECILKDADFHPLTDRVLHADFQVLREGEKVTIRVPVRYHGTPVGQTAGGDTRYLTNELTVSCLPKDMPSHIDVDVSKLKVNQSILVRDLELENVDILDAEDMLLVRVAVKRALPVDEEEEELLEGEGLEGEGEEGEEGEGEEGEGEEA